MRPMRAPGNPQLPSRRGAPSAHGQARGARKWVRRVGGLGFRSHDRSLWGSQGRSCKYRSASLGGCRRSRSFKLACVLLAAGHGCHPAPRAAPSIPTHLHGLRHFAATQMIGGGHDVRTVAGRLGHRDASTTLKVYSHFLPERDRDAADFLGKALTADE
jgi:integrase